MSCQRTAGTGQRHSRSRAEGQTWAGRGEISEFLQAITTGNSISQEGARPVSVVETREGGIQRENPTRRALKVYARVEMGFYKTQQGPVRHGDFTTSVTPPHPPHTHTHPISLHCIWRENISLLVSLNLPILFLPNPMVSQQEY